MSLVMRDLEDLESQNDDDSSDVKASSNTLKSRTNTFPTSPSKNTENQNEKDKRKEDDAAQNMINEMQMQTMYKMVEEITIKTDNGHNVMKKMLYLTNEQALMFDEKAVLKLLDRYLDLGESKFIIILEPAVFAHYQMVTSNPVEQGASKWKRFYQLDRYRSELNETDSRMTETQVVDFMRNILLPIAIETKAVILCQAENSCFLSASFALVAAAEQVRLGAKCPFKVITFVNLSSIYLRHWNAKRYKESKGTDQEAEAADGQGKKYTDSIAHKLLSESQAYRRREPVIDEHLVPTYKAMSKNCMKLHDVPSVASRVIVFENLDEITVAGTGKKEFKFSWGPQAHLYNSIIQCLTRKVPSVSVASFSTWNNEALIDRVFSKTPRLLIDGRERAISSRKLLHIHSPTAYSDPKSLDERRSFVTKFAQDTSSFPSVSK